MNEPTVTAWIVDDDASIRWVLEQALGDAGITCRSFDTAARARTALAHAQPDVLVSDIRMPGEDGLELLRQVRAEHPELPVIIMTAHSDLEAAVSAYEGGAFDYLPKPFDVDAAAELVLRAARHAPAGREADSTQTTDTEIIGQAPAMQQIFRAIGRLKRSAISVLLTGETGTGKELVARALHRHSDRASGPFIALNMAAIPPDLIESELFGHERGAFTGAQAKRIGRFEQADGGTLFLDEIGDMPAAAQTRLLRVLAENEFYRVGGQQPVVVDVRLIAATHQPLPQLVADGRFREDLYHRLNVVELALPPLRERKEDIPLLLRHFMGVTAKELGVEAKRVPDEIATWLARQSWPGNVRELENLCRRLTAMAPGNPIQYDDLPEDLRPDRQARSGMAAPGWQQQLAVWADDQLDKGGTGLAERVIPAVERVLIETALKHSQGQRGEAAKLLGWGRNTLTRKLKR
jgi:two-component system, NtrC family, nitrogen regulation response regulator GlnG